MCQGLVHKTLTSKSTQRKSRIKNNVCHACKNEDHFTRKSGALQLLRDKTFFDSCTLYLVIAASILECFKKNKCNVYPVLVMYK